MGTRAFTVNRAHARTEVALSEALISLSANPAAKAAFFQATSHESQTALHYVKATSSLYGGLLFWIGLWELIWTWGGTTWWREVIYFLVGMVMVCATDTLYFQGGIDGSFCPRCVRTHWISNIARIVIAPAGMVVLWVGAFDLMASFVWFDSYSELPSAGEYDVKTWAVQKCLIKDLACIIGGIGVILALGLGFTIANVEPPTTWTCITRCNGSIALGEDPWWRHALRSLRSVVSIFAQNAMWLGAWNLLENYFETTIWREIAYTFIGLSLFFATNTFWKRTHIHSLEEEEETAAEEEEKDLEADGAIATAKEEEEEEVVAAVVEETAVGEAVLSIGLILRALFSLLAFFIHITGFWTIFDSYILSYDNVWRNVAYVTIGIIMMVGSGTIQLHAGVYREEVQVVLAGEGEPDAMADTDNQVVVDEGGVREYRAVSG